MKAISLLAKLRELGSTAAVAAAFLAYPFSAQGSAVVKPVLRTALESAGAQLKQRQKAVPPLILTPSNENFFLIGHRSHSSHSSHHSGSSGWQRSHTSHSSHHSASSRSSYKLPSVSSHSSHFSSSVQTTRDIRIAPSSGRTAARERDTYNPPASAPVVLPASSQVVPPPPGVEVAANRFVLIKVHQHLNGFVMAEILDKDENVLIMRGIFDTVGSAVIISLNSADQEITIKDTALEILVIKAREE
ncbi:MAG: hypothetical protein SGI77_06435 [Pirellulaceae bacterium]|nr:hypothetical protein [Pirellulaceae bacterium]